MWKLIWKDSFHYDSSNYNIPSITYLLMVYSIFINLFSSADISAYVYIFGFYFGVNYVVFTIYPLKLAKGLYLCPLTEAERKKYLKTALYIRMGIMLLLLVLLLMVSQFFFKADRLILLLQFICTVILVITVILTSLSPSAFSYDMAKQQYYLAHNLPVPKKPKVEKEEQKKAIHGILILVTLLILSVIGVLLPMKEKEFHIRLCLYYIPSFLVSAICVIVYFKKYFDEIITINANREGYHYLRKKKVGEFHAY